MAHSDHTHADRRERVAIHCEATGFDQEAARPLSFAAIRIRGPRILAGSALRLYPGSDTGMAEAGDRLHAFIGDRPLIGYYLDFSVAMAERADRPSAVRRAGRGVQPLLRPQDPQPVEAGGRFAAGQHGPRPSTCRCSPTAPSASRWPRQWRGCG